MIHIGLFEGIGGFSIAAKWAGWKTYATCEIDPFCQKVLNYHFPEAYHHGDIHTLTYETINYELSKRYGSQWRDEDIILTGGFPCQPFSLAGKQKGTEDPRHLWPEMLRAIREIKPRWIVGENVRGIVTWSKGLVFEQVCAELEVEGYEVSPVILPACGVGAPHRRDRVWFVAHRADSRSETMREAQDGIYADGLIADPDSDRCRRRQNKQESIEQCYGKAYDSTCCEDGNAANTTSNRSQTRSKIGTSGKCVEIVGFDRFPTQSPICCRNDGFSQRLDGITFPKWREQSIKAYGNAIVPQVALQIFHIINHE